MSKFIKLNYIIINTNYIKKIISSSNKYNIYFTDYRYSGFFIFWFGNLESCIERIEICQKKSPEDYKIILDWIKKC